eukprot:scaffold47414_cov29-Tisochrysis_lutea.AAC.3
MSTDSLISEAISVDSPASTAATPTLPTAAAAPDTLGGPCSRAGRGGAALGRGRRAAAAGFLTEASLGSAHACVSSGCASAGPAGGEGEAVSGVMAGNPSAASGVDEPAGAPACTSPRCCSRDTPDVPYTCLDSSTDNPDGYAARSLATSM